MSENSTYPLPPPPKSWIEDLAKDQNQEIDYQSNIEETNQLNQDFDQLDEKDENVLFNYTLDEKNLKNEQDFYEFDNSSLKSNYSRHSFNCLNENENYLNYIGDSFSNSIFNKSFDSFDNFNEKNCEKQSNCFIEDYKRNDDDEELIYGNESYCCSSPDCKLTFKLKKDRRRSLNQNLSSIHLKENNKPFIQLKIIIPEFGSEKFLSISKQEKILNLKFYLLDFIEKIKSFDEQNLQLINPNLTWTIETKNKYNTINNTENIFLNNLSLLNLKKNINDLKQISKSNLSLNTIKEDLSNKEKFIYNLNYGLFCPLLGRFLEEERTIGDYSQLLNNFIFYNNLKRNFAQNNFDICCSKTSRKFIEQDIDLPVYYFDTLNNNYNSNKQLKPYLSSNQQSYFGLKKTKSGLVKNQNLIKKLIKYNCIELEFRYKQRAELLLNMSTTLPTSTQTKKKRKRGRLLEAISAGNVDKLTKLVQTCDPNFVDENSGETPLTLACSLHTTQTVATNASLNQNLNNNTTNNSSQEQKSTNQIALSGTEKKKEKESKFFTLKSSDKKDLANDENHSLINPKNVFNPNIIQKIIVILVNGGALLDFRAKEQGRTPLHVAVIKSNLIAIKTLLDLGCSPDHFDSTGLTPLYYSIIYRCSSKATQQLLQHHAGVNIRDNNGWCEIHHCCKFGSVDQLELLLYYGCLINAQISGSGNTALHVSAINDQQKCCKVLLQRGANIDVVNGSHQTAYQVAVIAGNMQLADLILNHKPENVMPYPEKPKYNSSQNNKRPQIDEFSSSTNCKSRDDFNVKYCNSPCLSQQSNATNACSVTTGTSSGVCCDTEDTTSNHSYLLNGSLPPNVIRIQSRKSLNNIPNLNQNNYENSKLSNNHSDNRNNECQNNLKLYPQTQIVSYNEKTVMLKRNTNKGFGFVLRGFKAPSPNQLQPPEASSSKNQDSSKQHLNITTLNRKKNKENTRTDPPSPPQCLRPISLQYFEDIEKGGVADLAGLQPGDYLINVNGVDVRSAIHEYVVNLIRQSGDQVTVTVATPNYQYDDNLKSDQKIANSNCNESRKNSIITDNFYDLTNKKSSYNLSPSVSHNSSTRCSSETLMNSSMPNSNSANDQLNQRRAPPPAPPKRDPNTTLSIGKARAKSLCLNEINDDDDLPPAPEFSMNEEEIKNSQQRTVQNKISNGNMSNNKNQINNTNEENYDSEGRSNKSSAASSPSAESIIHNVPANKNSDNKDINDCKVASIKRRNSRRVSAFEIEEYFTQKTNDNEKVNINNKCGTLQTSKKREKSNLEKKEFHSTSDIHAEVDKENQEAEFQKLSKNNLDQKEKHFETLTLKNGKFINDNSKKLVNDNLNKETKEEKDSNVNIMDNNETNCKNDNLNECKTSSSFISISSFKPNSNVINETKAENFESTVTETEKIKEDGNNINQKVSTFKSSSPMINDRISQSYLECKARDDSSSKTKEDSNENSNNQSVSNKNSSVNKVKESVKQFEKKTTNELGKKKLESLENMINSTTNNYIIQNTSNQTAYCTKIPTSKSCFEVDICDQDFSNNDKNSDENYSKSTIKRTATLSSNSNQYNLIKQSSISSIDSGSKAAPTMAKTWSEISSAIRAAKGNPPISTIASTCQSTKTMPSSSLLTKPSIKSVSTKNSAIRVQVDSLGLAAVNEVDVLAELVPPPPEFAAPNYPASQLGKIQLSGNNIISGTQSLQQQVHQAKQQQLLQQQQHKLQLQIKSNNTEMNKDENKMSQNPVITDSVAKARIMSQQQNQQAQQQCNYQYLHHQPLNQSQFATLTRYVKQQQLQAQQSHNNQQYVTLSRLNSLESQPVATTSCNMPHHVQQQLAQQEQLSLNSNDLTNLYNNCSSAQQNPGNQTNYYQFATLSRAAVAAANNNTIKTNNRKQNLQNLYSDYSKMTLQNQLNKTAQLTQAQSIAANTANSLALNNSQQINQVQQQQIPSLTQAQYKQLLLQRQQQLQIQQQQQQQLQQLKQQKLQAQQYQQLQQLQQQSKIQQLQQQQQQLKSQYQLQQQQQQKATMLAKKSIVDWSQDDVAEWVHAIGMSEHNSKFESMNGLKLLQLDILELQKIGIRQPQHRQFIMEKLKQHVHYQQKNIN